MFGQYGQNQHSHAYRIKCRNFAITIRHSRVCFSVVVILLLLYCWLFRCLVLFMEFRCRRNFLTIFTVFVSTTNTYYNISLFLFLLSAPPSTYMVDNHIESECELIWSIQAEANTHTLWLFIDFSLSARIHEMFYFFHSHSNTLLRCNYSNFTRAGFSCAHNEYGF